MQKISLLFLLLVGIVLIGVMMRLHGETKETVVKTEELTNRTEQLQERLTEAEQSAADIQLALDAGWVDMDGCAIDNDK